MQAPRLSGTPFACWAVNCCVARSCHFHVVTQNRAGECVYDLSCQSELGPHLAGGHQPRVAILLHQRETKWEVQFLGHTGHSSHLRSTDTDRAFPSPQRVRWTVPGHTLLSEGWFLFVFVVVSSILWCGSVGEPLKAPDHCG